MIKGHWVNLELIWFIKYQLELKKHRHTWQSIRSWIQGHDTKICTTNITRDHIYVYACIDMAMSRHFFLIIRITYDN